MIEKILAKGTLDIRLIVYYYYAHFFNNGIKSFLEIFPSIVLIINEHWEHLKPVNRRDKQVQNSLNWFILQIISKLKYCEKLSQSGKKHPIWTKSTEEISPEEFDQVILSLSEFKEFFHEKWPKSPTLERVMHLLKMVEDFKFLASDEGKKVEEEEIVEEEEEPVPELEEELDEAENDPFLLQDEMIEEAVESPLPEEIQPSVMTEERVISCENLGIISEKLRIFELLIQKNEFAKAALVAKDIDNLIENFDPLVYFPKLFSHYFALAARNVAALAEQDKESLQLQYLEKLYRTDPDKFMEW